MTSKVQPPAEASISASAFPGEDWDKVHIEAQAIVEIPLAVERTEISVAIINGSLATLDCGSNSTLALTYKLLDVEGRELQTDCIRTPLASSVPPGGRVTQEMAISIPEKYNLSVGAIKVGLVQRECFWIGRINRYHPRTILLDRGETSNPVQKVMLYGAKIWPLGRSNGLGWPHGTIMVSEKYKLMYIPVAKCACTSLKATMIALAEIEQYEIAIKLGVHLVTDRFNTGAQLKDKTMKRAWQIMASDEYFKFTVIREPFERLVSAYLEKFVYQRHNTRNLIHTRDIISKVQATDSIDLQRGITFDEFAGFIISQDPLTLDPHWRPQYLYMENVKHLEGVFRLENIGRLEAHLRQYTGQPVHLGHKNRTKKSHQLLEGAEQLTAAEIDGLGAFDPRSFQTSNLHARIADYYREDITLYSSAQ